MSFRVNTNVSAMNALRNVSHTNDLFGASIQRLSTGLRINSAADDPAGLIASEKFRAQIAGLGQAIRNSQDGINFVKTAEGALDEVNGLLRDARALAVASANTGTLSAAQIAANQSQIQSIAASITRIAGQTQFGQKKLLDGSSGVVASVTDATVLSSLTLGGSFGGSTIAASGGVAVTVTQAATQAAINSKALATAGTAIGVTGSFTINGVTFNVAATDTAQQVADQINHASGQTGVAAFYDAAGTQITIQTVKFGSGQTINLADANGAFLAAAGSSSATGVDALASVAVGALSALFTGSVNGTDGLTLSDTDGNSLRLTEGGNAVAASATLGQVNVGSAQFQIGSDSGQTASLSLGNFASSQLGQGVSSGVNLSNIDLTTASGASTAIQVIDKAVDDVTKARGQMGSFQRNVLESNIRSLGTAQENLAATESNIRDTDVAAEMTNFTKLQILQQAGMSVLAQANQAPQAVLALLR
ncbi:MAG: hypothetical protein HYR64_01715 [Fimbriimonas ginsengisoli]|uniref:Flagellin n=1 Tax=Fimbriimonas ginsengisoli TaxID=1005039 RepID=A0A931LR61_FIMGI|nr:hypothetical protein [Fimbriimonas ginsengisoli]